MALIFDSGDFVVLWFRNEATRLKSETCNESAYVVCSLQIWYS